MSEGILYLTLRTFSATGGIEKVSRQVGKALYELTLGKAGTPLTVMSMYDRDEELNEKYFPAAAFKGYGEKKVLFMWYALRAGLKAKVIILSHVNLLLAGWLIKLFSPKTKLVLFCHGIEVWEPLPARKRKMLKHCDQFIAVSHFTRDKLVEIQGIDPNKIKILNNCLDPFLALPNSQEKENILMERYHLDSSHKVLMTLTRLSSREKYKGYDNVLYAVQQLKLSWPGIKYLVVGKYDDAEKRRLEEMIQKLSLQGDIILAGFIPDEELAAHFGIADVYIMPSKKEGFGIVFIEAMYYGKPVIAGDKDGSVDALDNGRFGLLVDPDNIQEITKAIAMVLDNQEHYLPSYQEVINRFSFPVYKENLLRILDL